VAQTTHNSTLASEDHASAQAHADAIRRLAKAKGITLRHACRLVATELVRAARVGTSLDEAIRTVAGGRP
jgi:hypothetical protein